MFESLQSLDSITINYSSGIHIVNVILAMIMFGVALEIKPLDFKKLFFSPKPLFLGLCAQLLVLPAITFILVALGYKLIPPGVAMGMILVAACPGGNISNYMTNLAKGNIALAVSLTSINTIVAVFMTPLNFHFWGWLYVKYLSHKSEHLLQTLDISIPQMFYTLCILLLLPLSLGMLCAHFLPKVKERILKPVKIFSLIAFFVILIFALAGNLGTLIDHIFYIFIVVLIHNACVIFAGYQFPRLFKSSKINCQTISIETGIQNSGLGLALLLNPKIFPAGMMIGGMLCITAWWGVWHIISGLIISFCYRKINLRQPSTAAL